MKESLSQRELGHGNIINHNLIPLKQIQENEEMKLNTCPLENVLIRDKHPDILQFKL